MKTYNNGVIMKRFRDDEEIPEGFVHGMLPRTEEQKRIIREKKRKTTLEHYGVDNPAKSKKVQERIKKTNLERYGVEHALQSKELKEKAKKTNLERYGVEHALQSDEFKEKAKQTNIERYGTDNPSSLEEFKEKQKQTVLERYGVENPLQSEEIKEKVKKTNLERYGNICPMQSEEIQERIKKHNLEKYGVEYTFESEEIKEKAKKTLIEKYGVDCALKSKEVRDKIRETNMKRYGVKTPLQNKEILEKEKKTNQERYGVDWTCQRPEARAYSNDSKPNKDFAKLLEESNIEYDREFRIDSYSFDFKVGNVLIEINPSVTHNSLWSPFGGKATDTCYHKNKSEFAKDSGYICIHVFDWDDKDKIIGLLKDRETIYARKCEIKNVSLEDCNKFLNKYHLQGNCKGQDIRLGLYYNGELVSIMTFGKPRYNKKYQYELLRYCSIKNIIGGDEKLFKHFITEYEPESIISYCDNAKFSGKIYNKLGFSLISLGEPSRHWYSRKEKRHITDNLLRQRGYDQLFHENYGKGTSNEQLIIDRGYVPVYDCGQATYVWSNE